MKGGATALVQCKRDRFAVIRIVLEVFNFWFDCLGRGRVMDLEGRLLGRNKYMNLVGWGLSHLVCLSMVVLRSRNNVWDLSSLVILATVVCMSRNKWGGPLCSFCSWRGVRMLGFRNIFILFSA